MKSVVGGSPTSVVGVAPPEQARACFRDTNSSEAKKDKLSARAAEDTGSFIQSLPSRLKMEFPQQKNWLLA